MNFDAWKAFCRYAYNMCLSDKVENSSTLQNIPKYNHIF